MSEEIKITDLQFDHNNANAGTPRGGGIIRTSLRQLGGGRSILVDRNGKIIAGNKTADAAADIGIDDVILVRTDGTKIVAVMREDLDLDDPIGDARKLAYADNQAALVSIALDPEVVAADVAAGLDLTEFFFDDELDAIIAQLGDVGDGPDLGVDAGAQPNPRNLPLDIIFTFSECVSPHVAMALSAGWKWGVQSRASYLKESFNPRYPITFIDNEYFNYDHQTHAAVVARFKPKYATVFDIMSPAQAQAAGVENYFEFAQVLDFAEELAEHAENVILIPKIDVIDQIPEKFMLGYSVPTSHGGTPLHVDAFRGRRVHLLGGSWKAQLAHLAALGDDVVSIDNNYINRTTDFGEMIDPNGERLGAVNEMGFPWANNPKVIAMAVSLGAIAAKVNELYAPQE